MDTNAMGSGPPGDDMGPESGTGGGIGQLLDFNALNYEMFPDLTVATERTYKNQFFTRNSYPGGQGTMVCIFNTGSDFIDGKESYLTFTLNFEAGVQNTIFRYQPRIAAMHSSLQLGSLILMFSYSQYPLCIPVYIIFNTPVSIAFCKAIETLSLSATPPSISTSSVPASIKRNTS